MKNRTTESLLFALVLLGFFLGLASGAAALEDSAFASSVVKAKSSSARLLMGDASVSGTYLVGVEIDLAPETVTYWRQPGDAGEPPVFDFSRSENVASVEALYPAPKHIEEAGGVIAGYDARVIFPVRVTALDKNAPVRLALDLSYAACKTLCLPARAQLMLALPRVGTSPFAAELKKALALVPRKLTREDAQSFLKIVRRDDGEVWRLHYSGPGKAQDVFTEAPDPLYLDAAPARDGEGFDLTLAANGAPIPAGGVAATLTIVTDQGAIQAPALLK